jgi:hypothetical protein
MTAKIRCFGQLNGSRLPNGHLVAASRLPENPCGTIAPITADIHATTPEPAIGRLFDQSNLTTTLTLKTNTMGGLLYTVAVILLIIWAIGFFGYHAGGIIHVLLVIAVIVFLLRVIRSAD